MNHPIAVDHTTAGRQHLGTREPVHGGRQLRVLIVEDSADDATLAALELQRGGYLPLWTRVDTPDAMEDALRRGPWDVVVCDHGLPHFNALGALGLLRKHGLDVPFIIVSGTIGEERAVAAMKAGAHDYVMKGNLTRLVPTIDRELREARIRSERRRAQRARREEGQVSAALARVGRELIAALDSTTLLDRLCETTAWVLKCPVSVTFLFVEDGAAFVPVASFGLTPAEQEALGALRGPPATLSGLLAQLQRDDAVETAELPLGGGSEGDEARGAGRQLCIALRRGTDIIGLQAVAHRDGSPHFSVSVRRVARGIAQLASMALEHQRLVTELERANRLKSDFVATMSHELRTPLNVIIGYNELLRDHEFGHLTGEQMEVLQHVATSARELLDLVNAVLDLNRLETGRLPLNLQTTSVPDLLEEIRQETSALGRKRDLALNWNVAPDLPRLNTDALKLKVVLKNLVVNACKFTERGTVTVDAAPRDDGVEIAVTDTGMGIAPEALPLIFEPFRQLESTSTRRHGGVGLGLHIVHRLLDLLGGTVSVTSQLGQGSSFRVWVPQRADGEARVPHFAPSGRTTPTLPNSGGPRFPARSAPC